MSERRVVRIICGWGRCGSTLLTQRVSAACGMAHIVFRPVPHLFDPPPCFKTHLDNYPGPRDGLDVRAVFMHGRIADSIGSALAQPTDWLAQHAIHCGVPMDSLSAWLLGKSEGANLREDLPHLDLLNMENAMLSWRNFPQLRFIHYDELWNHDRLRELEAFLALPSGSLVNEWPPKAERATRPAQLGTGYNSALRTQHSLTGWGHDPWAQQDSGS